MKTLIFSLTKKDFDLTWFSGSGAGGQHRNKHQNCCRIRHPETGIIVTGQSQLDQQSNLREALDGLKRNKRFLAWCQVKCYEIEQGKTIEQIVDEWMKEENLKIEYKVDGQWTDSAPSVEA
jgi:peptide chain release factor 1